MGQITIVGLGPGDFGLITLDTWDKITNTDKLILRTAIHPTVAELDKRNVVYTSCDEFYEQGASFDDVYNSIAQKLIEEAKNLGVTTVFALTYQPDFFKKQGFTELPKEELPHKVWKECINCTKFPNCDEIALSIKI